MLEIIALVFTGRKFRELAEKYSKTKWKVVLGAILLYLASAVVTAVIMLILFDDVHQLVISISAMPIGFGACYGLYSFLENKWKREPKKTPEIDEIGKDQVNS